MIHKEKFTTDPAFVTYLIEQFQSTYQDVFRSGLNLLHFQGKNPPLIAGTALAPN
jgi:hypothetical protein